MKHPLDQRSCDYQPDHEAAELLAAEREGWLDRTVRIARLFKRMGDSRS